MGSSEASQVTAKPSEFQFREWSSYISAEDVDVRWLTSKLQPSQQWRILDVGGGIGQFASLVADWAGCDVDVIDPSDVAARNFTKSPRCRFIQGDFNAWQHDGAKYDLIIFRVVLHHLVTDSDRRTMERQKRALEKARSMLSENGSLYILENIYDPMVGEDVSGRLIFEATALRAPARLFRRLGANTAGEGVRFRSLVSWRSMLGECGLRVAEEFEDRNWAPAFPLWQRLPLLCRSRYQWLCLAQPVRSS